jgi:hypothetical protein
MLAWATPKLAGRVWICLAIPMAIMTSFIVSVGTQLQTAVFSAIGSRAPSIYAAAYGNAYAPFPSIRAWLSAGLDWWWLSAGVLIVLLSFRARRIKYFLPMFGVATAIVLTASDLLSMAFFGADRTQLVTNIIGNVLGGGVVALVCAMALVLYQVTIRILAEFRRGALVGGFVVLFLFGVSASSLTFFALRLLYDPLPARVRRQRSRNEAIRRQRVHRRFGCGIHERRQHSC